MGLADLVRQEIAASLSDAEALAAVRRSRLFFQRPTTPGFLVSETENGPVLPLFTSIEQLGRFAGPCDWASTTVADLVELVPEEVTVLIDPLSEQPSVLDVASLREASSTDLGETTTHAPSGATDGTPAPAPPPDGSSSSTASSASGDSNPCGDHGG